jgi:hypothetical protein
MMRMEACFGLVAMLLLAAGCAPEEASLYGSYRLVGQAGNVTSADPATLEITRPHQYTFCLLDRCETGKFDLLQVPSARDGRITLVGKYVEGYVFALSERAYGPDEIGQRRGTQNSIDLDYRVARFETRIKLGIGDIMFVKQ